MLHLIHESPDNASLAYFILPRPRSFTLSSSYQFLFSQFPLQTQSREKTYRIKVKEEESAKMPIAHISLPVSSLSASRDFYLATLNTLSYGLFMEIEEVTVGLAPTFGGPDFWVTKCPEDTKKVISKSHVAFTGKSQKQVREFYEAAL
jgi:hypothetical protein